MKPKKIAITIAKNIALTHNYDEVIVFGANYNEGIQHITTFGKDQKACDNAALGGNTIKDLLGWPKDQCKDLSSKSKKRGNRIINIIELKNKIDNLNDEAYKLNQARNWVAAEKREFAAIALKHLYDQLS